ncbi:SDR family oxidoreductase [Streptomyces sp. NPDC002225]|uniref:SDR family oxidoreductase n=1 Tax=Streptomyces sp. NPDC002225 TaxID=3154413 RepID=UPI00332C2C7C
MILVTGATGTVGSEVVRSLPAGAEVRVMARNPGRVAGAPEGTEVVWGDFGVEGSLVRALRGVRAVFLLTVPGGGDDGAFLRVAREAGVRHVVKLSAAAVGDSGAVDLITRWQRRNEELLRESGMEWTLLRPRAFMSNTLSWADSVRAEGVVRALYGESANACVDPRDVAEVAVRALTEDGHGGRIHTLTGPEPLSAVRQTALLGEVLGRRLRFEELEPEQVRAAWGARYPAKFVEALLESAERGRAGSKVEVHGTVPALLGRPARAFRQWAESHREAFGAA